MLRHCQPPDLQSVGAMPGCRVRAGQEAAALLRAAVAGEGAAALCGAGGGAAGARRAGPPRPDAPALRVRHRCATPFLGVFG